MQTWKAGSWLRRPVNLTHWASARAIWLIERRQFAHRLQLVAVHPLRLLTWLFWIGAPLLTGLTIFVLQVLYRRGVALDGPVGTAPTIATSLSPIAAGVLLVVAGGMLTAGGAERPSIRLPQAADIRFILSSPIRPRVVMAWLMIRPDLSLLGLFLLVETPWIILARRLPTFALALWSVVLFLRWGQLAAHLLHHRFSHLPMRQIGIASLVVGGGLVAMPLVRDYLPSAAKWLQSGAAHLPPNDWLHGAATGDWRALVPLGAATGLMAAIVLRMSDEFYPELIQNRAIAQQGGVLPTARPNRLDAQAYRALAPFGALGGLIWMHWLEVRRAAMESPLLLMAAGGSAIAGVAGGVLWDFGWRSQLPVQLLSSPPLFVFLLGAGRRPLTWARQFQNPFWWMAPATMRTRMLACMVGTYLVWALIATIAPVLGLLITGQPLYAILAAAGTLSAFVLFQAFSGTAQAIFPASLDRRGPYRVTLWVLTGLVFTVVLVVSSVVLVLTESWAWAGVAAAACLAAFTLGSYELAVWLLGRRGILQAAAEMD